ncbi:MAG: AAA family ATPase [Candidatus Woesearchaeota archaeon]
MAHAKRFESVFSEVQKVIIGQDEMVEGLLIGLLADGNVLLEGFPGLAKTLTVRAFADALDLDFRRIQNTPDLMPSDITGTHIIQESHGKREFTFQPGPVFTNILLADEINRATPKTQSALLEAMQEKQVTVANETFELELPFFVLATQNPIEQEGTYPLPEAQADRFLLKIIVGYPTPSQEVEIVQRYTDAKVEKPNKALSRKEVLKLQELAAQVPVSNDVIKKAVKLVALTRASKHLAFGASPRASISLIRAGKARALIYGRKHVSIDDVSALAKPVLRHRIIPNFEAERKGLTNDAIIDELLKHL